MEYNHNSKYDLVADLLTSVGTGGQYRYAVGAIGDDQISQGQNYGWKYLPVEQGNIPDEYNVHILQKPETQTYHLFTGTLPNSQNPQNPNMFLSGTAVWNKTIRRKEPGGRSSTISQQQRAGIIILRTPEKIFMPKFTLQKTTIFNKIGNLFKKHNTEYDLDANFKKQWRIYGGDGQHPPESITKILTPQLQKYLLDTDIKPGETICFYDQTLIYSTNTKSDTYLLKPDEITKKLDILQNIQNLICANLTSETSGPLDQWREWANTSETRRWDEINQEFNNPNPSNAVVAGLNKQLNIRFWRRLIFLIPAAGGALITTLILLLSQTLTLELYLIFSSLPVGLLVASAITWKIVRTNLQIVLLAILTATLIVLTLASLAMFGKIGKPVPGPINFGLYVTTKPVGADQSTQNLAVVDGKNIKRNTNTPALTSKDITDVATSGNTHCVIVKNQPYCWGDNQKDQTGTGKPEYDIITEPTKLSYRSDLANPNNTTTDIAVGLNHACAITNQKLYCWGDNTYGQLGITSNPAERGPAIVTPLMGMKSTKVAVSENSTCVIADTKLYCFGEIINKIPEKDLREIESSQTPILSFGWDGVTEVAVDANKVCVARPFSEEDAEQTLGCYGISRKGKEDFWMEDYGTITSLTAGANHMCYLDAGVPLCFGDNTYGQLGDNTLQSYPEIPVEVALPDYVPAGNITNIYAGANSSCMKANNKLYCWGENTYGQLGDGTTNNINYPVQANTPGPVTDVAVSTKTLIQTEYPKPQ